MEPLPVGKGDLELDKAFAKALRMLKAADKLSAEVEQALIRAGCSKETSGRVVALLSERRLLDDQRTITQALERAMGRRGLGKEKIRAELIARGAPETLVEASLRAADDSGEQERMLALLRARPGKDTPAKAGRFLASRGFSEESIEDALSTFFGDNGDSQ